MYGAIIGDLAGSVYEFSQTRNVSKIEIPDKLIIDNSFYSDDSILTIAILDAILNNGDYTYYLKKYGKQFKNYKPLLKPYFKTSFSPGFIKWIESNNEGKSRGNGAMMRIAPVGYLFNSEKEVIDNTLLATKPSHNSFEAIDCARVVSLIIFYGRMGLDKDEIIYKLNIKLKYEEFNRFNSMCSETINNCLYAVFSSNNFDESIRKVISYGGDTDTNACIVGSMAEALYGIDDSLISDANKIIPKEFIQKLERGYSKVKSIKRN